MNGCADAGRQGIARILRVHDAAPLYPLLRTPPTGRILISLVITITLRIRVDDATDGAMLRRHLGLHPAPPATIACDHDRALDGNAEPVELLVILAIAIIDVDEGRRHVAVRGVGVIGRQLLRNLIGRGIARDGRLFEPRAIRGRLQELDQPGLRSREKHLKGFDLRVETPFLEPCEDPFRVVLVVSGPDVMGSRGQAPHRLANVVRRDGGPKLGFPRLFESRRLRAIAEQRAGRRGGLGRCLSRQHRGGEQGCGYKRQRAAGRRAVARCAANRSDHGRLRQRGRHCHG